GQPALWRRRTAAHARWQAAARLGRGARLPQLVPDPAQIRPWPSRRDLRHSGNRPARAYARECPRRERTFPRWGTARQDDRFAGRLSPSSRYLQRVSCRMPPGWYPRWAVQATPTEVGPNRMRRRLLRRVVALTSLAVCWLANPFAGQRFKWGPA